MPESVARGRQGPEGEPFARQPVRWYNGWRVTQEVLFTVPRTDSARPPPALRGMIGDMDDTEASSESHAIKIYHDFRVAPITPNPIWGILAVVCGVLIVAVAVWVIVRRINYRDSPHDPYFIKKHPPSDSFRT